MGKNELIALLVALLVGAIILLFRRQQRERDIRRDAVQRSQAVTRGKVAEQFMPYLPDFRYNPKDARFIGGPIDFVVFDGLDEGEVKSVVFVEIKTGNAGLNSREKQVRAVVQKRKVEWVEIRLAED